MAAHPLLMDTTSSAPAAQSKKDRYKPMVPKFASTKANARLPPPPPPKVLPQATIQPEEELKNTPFYDPRLSYGTAGTSGRDHMGRGHARSTLKFNQRGKFVRLGEAMRAEAKMEELKKRILERAKQAGLESELEDQAKAVKRPPPPDVEWWDTPFLPPSSKSYDAYDASTLSSSGAVTHYVQHPIQIPAPGDKIKVDPQALFLTKKEMKKMRRQRRKAALEDQQDRIKMGLLPPPPPKVKLGNMMRVLTQDAIADPTKVEAKVRREMDARLKGHLKANAERKLTEEQKAAKHEEKMAKDEAKGIQAAAFKIRYLSNASHKFKVQKNATQMNLTGVTLFNPNFCLVLVEGGPKAVKFYKRLMLHRIDWTETALTRTEDEASPAPDEGDETASGPMGDVEEPESLADNYCKLIWEGQHREKMFRYFKRHNCPSEANARDVLGPKLEGLWDVARTEGKDEE